MKKLFALLVCVITVLSFSAIAFADAPANDKFTTQIIYSFEDIADGDYIFNSSEGDMGWMFYPDVRDNMALFTVEGNKMVIKDHYQGFVSMRFNVPAENLLDAATCAQYDMVGFYIENNTTEACGVSFFGENITSDNNPHQMFYQSTDFYDIESYLVDMDGNISVAEEYLDDMGHGCAEIPAGFKGYYMVTLDTCGKDYCYYGSWGWHTCDNGAWISGDSYLSNVGVNVYSIWSDIGETIVVDDYFLAAKGDNFAAGEAPAPGQTENTGDENASDVPTDVPTQDNAGDSTNGFPVWIIIAAVAAVVVVVVVVVIVAAGKKKKAE